MNCSYEKEHSTFHVFITNLFKVTKTIRLNLAQYTRYLAKENFNK